MNYVNLVVSFLSDFLITGGSAYTAAMMGAGGTQVPTRAALILSLVAGLVAGGRRLQALVAPSPTAPTVPPALLPKTDPVAGGLTR